MSRSFARRLFALAFATTLGAGCVASDDATIASQQQDAIGCGEQLEDRTAGLVPLLEPSALETVAELPYPAGNIAVSTDERVFFSFHPHSNKGTVKVAELVDGQPIPYPSAAFQKQLHTVLSIRIDRQGRLWMLDYGDFGVHKPRLMAIDLATDEPVFSYTFPRSAAPVGSMLNDFQVSPDGKTIYIADQSLLAQKQAIVVVDLDRDQPIARRRLAGHASLKNGPYDVVVDGERMKVAGFLCPAYGIDAIALDSTGDWLFYASLNSGELYRIATHDLRYQDSGLLDAELAQRVEKVADITMSDGATRDRTGHTYLTDMEHHAIVRVSPEGQLDVLVQDDRLRWPDGLGWGPSGHLYITASALDETLAQPVVSAKDVAAGAPYHIFRILPQAACGEGLVCNNVPGH